MPNEAGALAIARRSNEFPARWVLDGITCFRAFGLRKLAAGEAAVNANRIVAARPKNLALLGALGTLAAFPPPWP
jgi:hypothetical protein